MKCAFFEGLMLKMIVPSYVTQQDKHKFYNRQMQGSVGMCFLYAENVCKLAETFNLSNECAVHDKIFQCRANKNGYKKPKHQALHVL